MKKRTQEQVPLIQQYKGGYRRKPEDKHEVEVAEALAVWLLAAHCPFYGFGKGDWNPDSRAPRKGNRPRGMKVGEKA